MTIDFSALNKQQPGPMYVIPESIVVAQAKADPFDIEPIKEQFSQYKKTIEGMQAQAKAHKIVDQKSREEAVTMAGQARDLSKKLAKSKENITAEHRRFTSAVNNLVKFFVDPLESIVSDLKTKSNEYDYHLIIKGREQQKQEQARKDALQKQLNAEARKANVDSVVLPDIPADPTPKHITRTESGSSMSSRLVWKGFVINPDLVDRALCSPDQKKIDEAVAGGLRESAGLEIREEAQSRLRA